MATFGVPAGQAPELDEFDDRGPRDDRGAFARAVAEAGELLTFSVRAIAELRGVWIYFAEVLRQTRIMVVGAASVTIFLMLCIGAMASTFGNYFFRSLGASDYLGLFTAFGVSREGLPLMFGYVFAAKIGCGMTAEISSMKVAEELDAYQSVGIDPMRYVVATRLAATLLFVPIIFGVAVAAANLGAFIAAVYLVGEVSQGAFEGTHWVLQVPQDILFSFFKVLVIAIAIALVAMFNAWRVRGGPVEVGAATARSMVVNLVLIHVISGGMNVVLWGSDLRMPIGG